MDWLQFFDGMVGHLAWPLVFIVLLIVLRKHVGSLAERLLEFSFAGATAKFSAGISVGKNIVKHLPPLPSLTDDVDISRELEQGKTTTEPPKTVSLGRYRTLDSKWVQPNLQGKQLWDTTAAGQIISGFEAVDEKVREIGKTMGFEPSNGIDELMIMAALSWKDAISKEMLELYRTLHNGVTLVSQARALPSSDETLEYVRQAAYLLASLTNLKHRIDRGQIKL
jgi:hypothetical protein